MKYAVLIELSRTSIAFRYFRDDIEKKFFPFDEGQEFMPLAIYCQGNDLRIGQYALSEVAKHNPCAWMDIFSVVANTGNFDYRGQKMGMNKLLFVAIRKYLDDFFNQILIKTQGDLEENISSLPLVFLFHPDLSPSDKAFVRKSFYDGGFINLTTFELSEELVKGLQRERLRNKMCVLVASVEGSALCVSAVNIIKEKEIRSLPIKGKGVDPRINDAVKLLWRSLGHKNYGLKYDDEYEKLRFVAEIFLRSNDDSLERTVLFSDGREREVFVSRHQLEDKNIIIDVDIKNSIHNFISELELSDKECVIAVCGILSSNEYFIENLKAVGPDVITKNDKHNQDILTGILSNIIERDLDFRDSSAVSHPLDGKSMIKFRLDIKKISMMAPQVGLKELKIVEDDLLSITPSPSDLQSYLDQIKRTKEQLNARMSCQSKLSPMKSTLPPDEIKRVERILELSLKIIPENAIKQLETKKKELLQKKNYDTEEWVRKIDILLRQVKDIENKKDSKTRSDFYSLTSNKSNIKSKSRTGTTSSSCSTSTSSCNQKSGNLSVGNFIKSFIEEEKLDLNTARKLFTNVILSSNSLPASLAIKALEALLLKLHKANIHNFDVQLNGRIKQLKK